MTKRLVKIEDELKGRFRNEFHKGLINLTYTANLLNHNFTTFMLRHGLTSQQYNVLRILRGFEPTTCSIAFIKERMLDKNSDVSRIVDRLHSRDLISRTENQADRRQKDIKLTVKGHDLLNDMFACELKVDTLLNNLSEEEVRRLNELLDKIRG